MAAAAPIDFGLRDARVIRPVRVTFQIRPGILPAGLPTASGASAVWLAIYDSSAGAWQSVAGTYELGRHSVTALLPHLGWVAPWTWDWGGMALRLRQALSGFGSGRAPAASCPGIQQVTVTSLGAPDPPLRGCAALAKPGTLTVDLTNNRGMSMVMTGVPADATPGPVSYSGAADWLTDSVLRAEVTRELGGADLPPGETLTYTVPLHGGPDVFTGAPSLSSYALDLAFTVDDTLLGEVTHDYATCVLDALIRSQPASLADAERLATSCVAVAARTMPALSKIAKKLPKEFGRIVQLVIFDVQRILNDDIDQVYDAVRGVRGKVEIDRPAQPSSPRPPTPVTPPPASGLRPGYYDVNRALFDDGSVLLSLATVHVLANGSAVFYVSYTNVETSSTITLTCAGDTDPSETYLVLADGQTVRSTDTYCSSNPNAQITLQPALSFASYAAFPSGGDLSKPFTFHWFAGSDSGTLSAVRLTARNYHP